MIKATTTGANGKPLLILGLEERNLDLLRDGKPIVIDGAKLGLDNDVFLFACKDPMDGIRILKKCGFNLPTPKIMPGDARDYEGGGK